MRPETDMRQRNENRLGNLFGNAVTVTDSHIASGILANRNICVLDGAIDVASSRGARETNPSLDSIFEH